VKRLFTSCLFILASLTGVYADETAFYDSKAEPVAYIAEDDTIYLWSGEPVAYLYQSGSEIDIYGFNGNHLGWYVKGVIFDHDGYAVGAIKEMFSSGVGYSGYKSFKQFKPFKSFKEFRPFRPNFQMSWSDMDLTTFLNHGAD